MKFIIGSNLPTVTQLLSDLPGNSGALTIDLQSKSRNSFQAVPAAGITKARSRP